MPDNRGVAYIETGKVKVKPKVTSTPTGGDPSTQAIKVKLKKNR
jgi:hypothetical protein